MELSLIFDNPSFVAVDKPAGSLSVPSRIGADDPRICVGIALEQRFGRVFPVHRLDADVSGLILFAKDAKAHKAANAWFEQRVVKKSYEALSEGSATDLKTGRALKWESCLLRGKKRAYESPHGKKAVTLATFLGTVGNGDTLSELPLALRWSLEPLTGRSHQLRYELARHGFPILGDTLYGAKQGFEQAGALGPAIALRSVRLDFSGCTDAKLFGLPDLIRLDGFT